MHRFYLPPEQCRGRVLVLESREAHHGLHVLRLRSGERAVVLDGAGREILCEVREAGRERLELAVVQVNQIPRLPYELTLVQALPKGRLMESIVEKATELGAARIVPIMAERSVPQIEGHSAESKLEKWRLTAIEAIKQCGSAWLPEIAAPVTPRQYLETQPRFELPLAASLGTDRRHPRDLFKAFVQEHGRRPQSICVWVGPEGDFTPAELGAIRGAGALPITLGPLILRTETAAIYCLSVLNYELQAPQ